MNAIELQPLADAETDLLQVLGTALQDTFHVPVLIRTDSLPLAQFYDLVRGQYNSTEILHFIDASRRSSPHADNPHPQKKVSVVAITGMDLFMPILTYVFGEAVLGGDVAVVSYHRFRNELYGLPSNRRLLLERLCKVAIHELGHTLGLVHCSFQHCVMHAASYVEELDLKGHEFCPYCRSSIGKSTSARG